MGRQIWPGKDGEVGGLISSGVFVLFLSPLVWYGQIHKDTFVLPAVLGILLIYFSLLNSHLTTKAFFKVCWAGVGALLVIFLMRPNYYCLILSAFLSFSLLILAFFYVLRGGLAVLKKMRPAFLFVGLVSALSLCTLALPSSYLRKEFVVQDASAEGAGANGAGPGSVNSRFFWQNSPAIPRWMDQYLEKTSRLRVHFIGHSVAVGAGSGIDLDQTPKNINEMIAYLPRAMWIGLFAPFPSQWLEKMSAVRLVSSVETFLWYLFFPGVVYLAIRKPSPAFWAGTLVCVGMITLFSYVNPNLGTLYRVRFGFWFFFLTCGAVGWTGALRPLIQSNGKFPKSPQMAGPPGERRRTTHPDGQTLSRFFSMGSIALVLSWLGFLGFFLRDLILVRFQGLVGSLDALMSAGMFVAAAVSCLSLPLADAISRPLQESLRKNRAQAEALIQEWLRIALIVLGGGAVLLWLAAPRLGVAFFGDFTSLQTGEFIHLFRLSVPILLISAWTVLGNAVLNNLYKAGLSAAAQLPVPLVAIVAIVLAPAENKLAAAVIGMVLGTFLNALLVATLCAHHGIRLWPAWKKTKPIHPWLSQTYVWLVPFAALSALTGPVNYFFAGQVKVGGITLWALAGKITACFSQFISLAAAALILPHLSGIIERGKHVSARDNTYLLVILGTWLGGVLALGLSLFADPLAALVLSESGGQEAIRSFTHLVRIGALQIPVAMAAAILVKSATATGAAPQATWAAFLGLLANILTNLVLIPRIGLTGVACGALVGTAITTLMTCLATRSGFGISRALGTILVFGWAVWAGVVFSVESRQGWGMVAATAGLIILALLHREGWKRGWVHRSAGSIADVRP
jgi:peptidoglycan biosynthesis protein MviN/MurJ (putative lipid II flippase)